MAVFYLEIYNKERGGYESTYQEAESAQEAVNDYYRLRPSGSKVVSVFKQVGGWHKPRKLV